MSLVEILVNSLIEKKQKGLSVNFKTDGTRYMVYVGGSLNTTMNKVQFDKFFKSWNTAKSLLNF